MFVVVSPTYICHNHCVYLPSVTASIGFFYFLLNNLPPYMRSKTDSIQLIANIVKSRFIKKYSMQEILKPLISDLKKLVCLILY